MFAVVMSVLGLLFKHLPLLLGLLKGVGNFLEKFKPAPGVEIDEESLARLFEEMAEKAVHDAVNRNKHKITVILTDEEKEIHQSLDELEKKLIADKERHEREQREKAAREEFEKLKDGFE